MSLATLLREKAKIHSSKVAFILNAEKLSYGEWEEKSNRLANALLKLGIKKGDRIVILLPSSAEFMACYIGVIKAGAWATPLDIRFSVDELDFLFQDCQPQAIISESPYLEAMASHLPKYTSLRYIISLSTPTPTSSLSYQELLAKASAEPPRQPIAEGDVAHLRYTSGTTGRPKAGLITHGAEQAGARMGSEILRLTEKNVFVLPVLPPSWFLYMVSYILYFAGTIVVVPESRLDHLLEAINLYKGTAFLGIPTLFTDMLALPDSEVQKYDLSHLKLCVASGMPLRQEVANHFHRRFGMTPISFLGYTEVTSGPAVQPVDGSGKPGATGKMAPGWEYKIVDESGQTLSPNQVGELVFRSPAMADGYYNRPQATAEAFHDGWFSSGDMGRIDEDGFLFLMGRKKEMISLAGKEIFPLDVEEALLANPKVAEVAAVGIPGRTGMGALKIAIVLKRGAKATTQEILDSCRPLGVVPEDIEFRSALPRTASGKVRRSDLKGVA